MAFPLFTLKLKTSYIYLLSSLFYFYLSFFEYRIKGHFFFFFPMEERNYVCKALVENIGYNYEAFIHLFYVSGALQIRLLTKRRCSIELFNIKMSFTHVLLCPIIKYLVLFRNCEKKISLFQ